LLDDLPTLKRSVGSTNEDTEITSDTDGLDWPASPADGARLGRLARARGARPRDAARRVDPRMAAIAVILVHAVIFLWLFKLPGLYYETGSDTQKVFWPATQRLLAGGIPYVDPHFFVEYPPLATAVFVLPGLLHPASLRAFDFLFAVEILLVDAATLPLALLLARRAGISTLGAVVSYGLLIPLLGAVACQRFDLVPATLVLGAALALLSGRSLPAWLLLLAATLIKVYPLALVPFFLLYDWRRGRRAGAIVYALGLAGSLLAWYLAAPSSLGRFVQWETRRGIEMESVQASVVELLHLAGLPVRILSPAQAFGSWDISAAPTAALGSLSTLMMVALLGALYLSYGRDIGLWSWPRLRRARAASSLASLASLARGPSADRPSPVEEARALLTYATLAVLVLLLGSKLFSIQFLLWLLPLLAVQPYDRVRTVALAIVATALSQSVFPFSWNGLLALQPVYVADLALRNALLIAVLVLVWRARGRGCVRGRERDMGTMTFVPPPPHRCRRGQRGARRGEPGPPGPAPSPPS